MKTFPIPKQRTREQIADWLAVAVAVALPWSTSATVILIVAWVLALLPTLDAAMLRRALATAAGLLPVVLCALAVVGMAWADVSWKARFAGLFPFVRMLFIPLLLAQFQRSEFGIRVLIGFFASVSCVLLLSWMLVLFPALLRHAVSFGVPVKDYILQSDEFLMCAFVLLGIVCAEVRKRRWRSVAVLVACAGLFLGNVVFVATGRTTLLVAPALSLLLGWREFRWKGLVGSLVLLFVLGAGAAIGSPYLRGRLQTSFNEWRSYQLSDAVSSTSLHLVFLKKSLSFVEKSPIIGHGTGSITEEFAQATIGKSGVDAAISNNPHNQFFAVAIQLGAVGAVILIAMWSVHLLLFRGRDFAGWIGTIVVAQNVISSLVNSSLFDFTQAWLYVFGVGIAGGMVLRTSRAAAVRPKDEERQRIASLAEAG